MEDLGEEKIIEADEDDSLFPEINVKLDVARILADAKDWLNSDSGLDPDRFAATI